VRTLIVLLSEAQWCFSASGEAIMSNEMTESDSERGEIGSSLREIGHITKFVGEITEMVGQITEIVGEITEMVGQITEIVGESTEMVDQITEIVSESTEMVDQITEIVVEITEIGSISINAVAIAQPPLVGLPSGARSRMCVCNGRADFTIVTSPFGGPSCAFLRSFPSAS
jgi:hypothetical protein